MEKNVNINDIYQIVLRNYYNAMQEINIESAEEIKDIIDYIKNQFNEIIELLRKCQNGIISIESIKLLCDVSFKDYLKDKYIIEAVSSNHTAIDDNNIFIMKTPKFIDDDCSFFRIEEEDGHFIAIRYYEDKVTKRDISPTELKSFVSLNKVLNDSDYIGYSANIWIDEVAILYSGQIYSSEKYFTLYKAEGNVLKLYVTDKTYSANGFFQNIYYTKKWNPYIKSSAGERCINDNDGIADRAFILKVIEEQLNKQYNKPEDGKNAGNPAVLSLKEKQNNNC